jgi:type II secretory pathway predicted ATPase ExeA
VDHLSTFGLDRDPFGCDAQLLWYFEGAGFAAATQRLQRAALQGKGLCVVTGRGGVGKTMLVRHLLQVLEEEVYEASMLVAVPGITDLRWLLTRWAQQLGVESPASELAAVLAQLYEQLAIVREDGRKAVLIIDEAQVLAERGILAELRGLLNLEYEEKRLVTLVLVGAPSLAEALSAEPALRERIDLRVSLQPIQPREVVGYLHHRIRAAGGNPAILESSAVAALTKLCGGLPRRINAIADDALFHAHSQGRVSATAADVERAAAELDATADAPVPPAASASPTSELGLAPMRAERSALAAAPARRSKEPALPPAEALLGGSDSELELGDVIAEPTGRRAAPAASATVVMASARSLDDSDELAPEQGREFRLDDTGELEDLFADIVDE